MTFASHIGIKDNGMTALALLRQLALTTLIGLGAMAAVDPSASFAAQPSTTTITQSGTIKDLQLAVGKSVIVDLPADAAEIYVGEPKVANAIARSARRIYVTAVGNGQTTIFALGSDGSKIAIIEISVGRDVAVLKQLLDAAIPNNDINVRTVGDSLILSGTVETAGDAAKAMDIASGFIEEDLGGGGSGNGSSTTNISVGGGGGASQPPNKGKVINSLVIKGLNQVALKVTVAEIRRDIVKQLGLQFAGTFQTGNFKPGIEADNPFAVNGPLTNPAITLGWAVTGSSFSADLSAFERQGVSHTLAEPTVTAVSGESAKFLAGGTIPIPVSESCPSGVTTSSQCVVGYQQQPYGVTLNFTPIVLAPGRIQLHIGTEVTDIDRSVEITNGSITIPGFKTRRNETTIELPSGGSIATAGLISSQTQQAITGIPGLMNLPILGPLFRSRDFQRDESELLVIVTPYIVHAVDPKQVVRPDQNFSPASDPQAWLLGRVNRIYSNRGDVEGGPAYAGQVGFITK